MISSIKMKNSRGPRTDPCGTPETHKTGLDDHHLLSPFEEPRDLLVSFASDAKAVQSLEDDVVVTLVKCLTIVEVDGDHIILLVVLQ